MSTTAEAVATPVQRKPLIRITLLAWFAIVSLDFFLNAGLFARFYHWSLPGFLPPMKMFAYIPLGYAAFLFWSVLLVWLMTRLSVRGLRNGARFGATVGALLATAGFCGELSIFAFPVGMLFLWAVVNTLSFTVGGAVAGAGLASARLRPLALRVVLLFVACLIGGFVLQNIGPNPAVKTVPGRTSIGWDDKR